MIKYEYEPGLELDNVISFSNICVRCFELQEIITFQIMYLENNVFVIFKLYHHMTGLPVNIPSLHGGVSPRFQMISLGKSHPHDPVGTDSKQLLLLLAMEPHHKQTNSILGQRLPGANKIHF